MNRIFKIVAMLFLISTVVFAAGCAEKPTTKENETPGAPNQTAPAISGENVTPPNGSAPAPMMNESGNMSMNVSGMPPMNDSGEKPPMPMNGSDNMTSPAPPGEH